MKKLLAIISAAAVLCGAFVFSGCEERRFSGIYTVAATGEEVRSTLTELDVENFMSANTGLKIDFEIETDSKTKVPSQESSVTVNTNTEYRGDFALKIEDGQPKGSGKINAKTTGMGNGNLKANLYLVDNALYFDITMEIEGTESSQKYKVPLTSVTEPPVDDPSSSGEFDLETLVANVESGDILVYFDKSIGTKMKVVLTQDYLYRTLGQEFRESEAEIYVSFDRNGVFAGARAEISADMISEENGMLSEIELSVEIMINVRDVKITVPDDLDTYV